MAVAVESNRLHERIALRVLLLTGSNPRWLILGFQIATMLISMWISNTGTVAMMTPIALAVIHELERCRIAMFDFMCFYKFYLFFFQRRRLLHTFSSWRSRSWNWCIYDPFEAIKSLQGSFTIYCFHIFYWGHRYFDRNRI